MACSSRTTRIGPCAVCSTSSPWARSRCAASATRCASYQVERAKPRAFRVPTRGVEGVETRTVGRDEELGVLRDSFNACRRRRRGEARHRRRRRRRGKVSPAVRVPELGGAGAVRGVPVHGPSARQPSERRRSGCSAMWWRRGSTSTTAIPRPPVLTKLRDGFAGHLSPDEADVVGHWLGFELSSSPAVQRLLGAQFSATARAHLLGVLRGARGPGHGRARARGPALGRRRVARPARRTYRPPARASPARARAHPAGVGSSGGPGGRVTPSRRPRLDLPPLTDTDSRALVREVLQRVTDVPDELVELVVSRADGNAFYVEELIKMLIDDGVIDTSVARGRLAGRPGATRARAPSRRP